MKIKKLVLENFGLFRGRNEIDLDTRVVRGKIKPIVLIGGKNGAGKTSILESIRLCLYGPQGIADRISVKGYEQYLRGRVHRDDSLLINPTSAAVTLVFEHAHIGAKHEFAVTRSWDLKENSVSTSLEILRDDIPLDEIDRENAEEFLRDLVPPGVAQLYFFDGEKIQELAEAEDVDLALSEAIKNLLGLELVDRLQADLRIYKNRIDSENANAGVAKEIETIDMEIQNKTRLSNCVKAAMKPYQKSTRFGKTSRDRKPELRKRGALTLTNVAIWMSKDGVIQRESQNSKARFGGMQRISCHSP